MKRVFSLVCVLSALVGGGVVVASSASAESGRRICLYGEGVVTSSLGKEYRTLQAIDYKKDGKCPRVNKDALSKETNIPVTYNQPVPKITCEELPKRIGGNPFGGADMCSRMWDDSVYVFFTEKKTGKFYASRRHDDISNYR